MMLLYELSVFSVRRVEKKSEAAKAEEGAAEFAVMLALVASIHVLNTVLLKRRRGWYRDRPDHDAIGAPNADLGAGFPRARSC